MSHQAPPHPGAPWAPHPQGQAYPPQPQPQPHPHPAAQPQPYPAAQPQPHPAAQPQPYPAAHPQQVPTAAPALAGVVAVAQPGVARVEGCRHAYPLTARTPGFGAALKLALKVLPYSLFRFAHWSAFAAISALMLVAVLGIGSLLTIAVNKWVGIVVIFGGLVPYALFWLPFVERKTFGTKCGHIGLLTELITKGEVGDGKQGLHAYAKHIVATRLGDMSTLWDVHRAVNRTLRQLTKLLDFIDNVLPIDISVVKRMIYRVVRGASRYLDAVILSYGFARGDRNMIDSAIDGLGYCAQNSAKIFRTAIGVLVLEKLMMLPLWLGAFATAVPGVFAGSYIAQGGSLAALQANAAAVVKAAPLPFVISLFAGVLLGALIAALVVRTVRESLVQPVLTTMVMLRFHTMVENQALDPSWAQRMRDAGDGLGQLDDLRRRAT